MTEIPNIFSLDKNYKLEFYNPIEPRMGMNMSKFSLTNQLTNEKLKFPNIWTLGYNGFTTSWADNSNYFSLAIGNPFDCFFVFNISTKQFAVIRFLNVWVLEAKCLNQKIEIEYCNDQIPENIEHNKYPTRYFTKPKNLEFGFEELRWFNRELLDNFKKIEKEIEELEFKPIDNGWREFKGMLPQTTEIIVWELQVFANYGDKKSKTWLNEILSIEKEPNLWTNASNYIGLQKR